MSISAGEKALAVAAFSAVAVAAYQAHLTSRSIEVAARSMAQQSLIQTCARFISARFEYVQMRRDYDVSRSAGQPGLLQGPVGSYGFFSDSQYHGFGEANEHEIVEARYRLDQVLNEVELYGLSLAADSIDAARALWTEGYPQGETEFFSHLVYKALDPIAESCREFFDVKEAS